MPRRCPRLRRAQPARPTRSRSAAPRRAALHSIRERDSAPHHSTTSPDGGEAQDRDADPEQDLLRRIRPSVAVRPPVRNAIARIASSSSRSCDRWIWSSAAASMATDSSSAARASMILRGVVHSGFAAENGDEGRGLRRLLQPPVDRSAPSAGPSTRVHRHTRAWSLLCHGVFVGDEETALADHGLRSILLQRVRVVDRLRRQRELRLRMTRVHGGPPSDDARRPSRPCRAGSRARQEATPDPTGGCCGPSVRAVHATPWRPRFPR